MIQRHSDSKKASDNIFLHDPVPNIHPVRSQPIDEEIVSRAGIKTEGGSGPSSKDVEITPIFAKVI